ncbi:MAG TPA: hypothetical protein VHQ47_13600 [Phycisphaerae bacterium]|nr:hypothetical protein [Phycisphaerae bacterium]
MPALELRAKPLDSTQRPASPATPVISINVPPRRPQGNDTHMMYAWSIGTTRIAQEHAAEREHADCPPEVYIG